MTPNRITARARFAALIALALIGSAGCAASAVPEDDEDPVASTDEALFRGTGSHSAGFTCDKGGTCTCDKSIENDCEDMTAVCTDATVDGVITCINGWATTHCTCTKAMVYTPPKTTFTKPIGVVQAVAAF